MLSGIVFLALASLAGIPPSAGALANEQQQSILHIAPLGTQRNAASEWEPSAFEEDEQEDAKRHSSEQRIARALTSAICGLAVCGSLDAPRCPPASEAQRFEIFLGLARGPPARG